MYLKKIWSFFLALAMAGSISEIHAYAAEKTQDGVKLAISTDKSGYEATDSIVADISLQNNSSNDITDVSLESVVPEKYHLSDESRAVTRTTYIKAGDSLKAEVVFVPDVKESSTEIKEKKEAVIEEKSSQAVESDDAVVTETKVSSETAEETDEQSSNAKLVIILLILAIAAGGAVVIFKKKGKKDGLMILLCITAAGSLAARQNVYAEDSETKTISVTENVSVGGEKLELTATVKFTMDIPDMELAVEEYYAENSEEIVAIETVEEKDNVFTEKEVISFLAERGFSGYPVTYEFNIDGTYADDAEASANSDEKHPMYQTMYAAENGSVWSIFIVGRTIVANPVSYNLESDLDAQMLVSEKETLTSYTEMGNKFYETVPKDSAVILKIVDQISSKKLNEMSYEEVIGK